MFPNIEKSRIAEKRGRIGSNVPLHQLWGGEAELNFFLLSFSIVEEGGMVEDMKFEKKGLASRVHGLGMWFHWIVCGKM